jgi:hypothetical protein
MQTNSSKSNHIKTENKGLSDNLIEKDEIGENLKKLNKDVYYI